MAPISSHQIHIVVGDQPFLYTNIENELYRNGVDTFARAPGSE
jgi:hypothetical protein